MPQNCLVQCGGWQIQNPQGRSPRRELVRQPEAGCVNVYKHVYNLSDSKGNTL